MDADTYPRADVQEALAAYVCVHIDAEKEGVEVAKQYGVNSYPRLMILDPSGRKLMEIKGKPAVEGFGERLPYNIHMEMAQAVLKEGIVADADLVGGALRPAREARLDP